VASCSSRRTTAAVSAASCRGRPPTSELARLGFSALDIGVLAANCPARGFYAAMGGREIGQRMFDEEGYLLPMTIYAWSDIAALVGDAGERPGA
jgi:hypothetical protein